jgi:hypothetical protein
MKINGNEISNLVTFGCSFTYGQGLNDRNKESWTALLANKIGLKGKNFGEQGSGNENTLNLLIDLLDFYNNSLVIISLTSLSRIEFINAGSRKAIFRTMPLQYIPDENPYKKFVDQFFDRYFDEEYYYLKYLRIIISLQEILKSRQIPYIMFEGFGNLSYHTQFLTNYKAARLIKEIDKTCFIKFQTADFTTLTDKTKKLPCGHPGFENQIEMTDILSEFLLNKYNPEW